MADRFPHGVTLKKKEGTQISVESQAFRLTRLISERAIAAFQERLAVFEGQRLLDEEAVFLKLRFQMDPFLIEQSDRPAVLEGATNFFREECCAVKKCETTGHTPISYGCAELRQDNSDMFPGGYLHVLAMSRVPGCAMMDIKDLTENEISIIREQLTKILEGMRLQGFVYCEGAPEQVFYDRGDRQTYLTGLSGLVVVDPSKSKPITQSSGDVLNFDLGAYLGRMYMSSAGGGRRGSAGGGRRGSARGGRRGSVGGGRRGSAGGGR